MGIIEETIRNMESGLYDYTNNGKCSSCGQCCSNLLVMSETDISRIKMYVKKHNIKPCNHFLPTTFPLPDAACPFRDNDKKICTIYKFRPVVCRDFRCDKAKNGYMPSKKLLEDDYKVVNVRELFFGK